MKRRIVRIIDKTLKLFFFFLLLLVLSDIFFPFRFKVLYSPVFYTSEGELAGAYLSSDDKWRLFSTLNEITPALSGIIINKEDRYFKMHPGVNPFAVIRAAFNNIVSGKRTSGASTISMQVVRLLKPADRTVFNKLTEAWRAMQLELHYTKDEILQLYLNLIPYGGNIEGIKAASHLYFGKAPQLLSASELTTLAIIPNRPSSLRLGEKNDELRIARDKWIMRFVSEGIIAESDGKSALEEPLNPYRRSITPLTPHLNARLMGSVPANGILKSTIQHKIQQKANILLKNYAGRIRSLAITNAAVIVIENETGNILAYAGSADFDDKISLGQVDGVKAIRSPGSTLKPFAYEMAFEKGILTPKQVLHDVPVNYEGYEPLNFDKKFSGTVTADKALANSLNIPAVNLLNELKVEEFTSHLVRCGFASLAKQKKGLGLSMILGGCGVTLEELTNAYAMLARNGVYKPISYLPEQKKKDADRKVLDPRAVFLVHEILTNHKRPDLPNEYVQNPNIPKIAWKTGTSYGRRDAWSIGYNRKYTIGVWCGNFDGKGIPELTGADIATPLLFELFNSIEYRSTSSWYAPPAGIDVRMVCGKSGNAPAEFCTETQEEYFIPGVSKNVSCNHMIPVWVNAKKTESYCSDCMLGKNAHQEFFDNLEPELIAWYNEEKLTYKKIPPHFSGCNTVKTNKGKIKIISPLDKAELLMEKAAPSKVMLKCNAPPDVTELYWYVDDKWIGRSVPSKPMFVELKNGQHKISCMDDKGRNAAVNVVVKYY